jgi:hypothetical protein
MSVSCYQKGWFPDRPSGSGAFCFPPANPYLWYRKLHKQLSGGGQKKSSRMQYAAEQGAGVQECDATDGDERGVAGNKGKRKVKLQKAICCYNSMCNKDKTKFTLYLIITLANF